MYVSCKRIKIKLRMFLALILSAVLVRKLTKTCSTSFVYDENFVEKLKIYKKMHDSVSVYQLITKLCASLIKESDEEVEGFTVKDAKSLAFNVLLKSNCDEVPGDEKLFEELQFASFELSLANRKKESTAVNQFVETLKENPAKVESSCWFLLHLKNIDPDPANGNHQVIIIDGQN